jgi:hypothetical protein
MRAIFKVLLSVFFCFNLGTVYAGTTPNQTDDTSTILSPASLPFRVVIERANFQLPVGFHSGVVGEFQGFWIFIAGRINGMHGFGPDPFPVDKQNTSIYVVNSKTGAVYSRSLTDPSSGLSQKQIDTLSVTSPQGYQDGSTLYMTGGYGIDTSSRTFMTQPVLTAIYLPGIVQWVTNPGDRNNSVKKNIAQLYNSVFQITGGKMFKTGNTVQLVFGQNFTGDYTSSSNGNYSQQVRQFQINGSGGQLSISNYTTKPTTPDPNYRRRDLNIVPALLNKNNLLQYSLIAYAGVFTPDSGVWTVPVVIDNTGNPTMANPNLPSTFKQGMNHYACATAGLYSNKYSSMFNIFFGGISYGYYDNGVFTTDTEIPFINQVTTVKIDKNGNFTQHIMDSQYPVIASTGTNPGNTLLFGAGAYFIPANIQQYQNRVINLDNIRSATVIGYIVGGIQSTLANTNDKADSSASPYVFKVTLVPTR